MSALIRVVEVDIGQWVAAGVAGITWQGTSADGALWPGQERPAGQGSLPRKCLIFVSTLARPRPVTRIRGGSSIGRLHTAFLRFLAVSAVPGDSATPYGYIQDIVEYAHYTRPAAVSDSFQYSRCECIQGPAEKPAQTTNEHSRWFADFQVEYSEVS